MILVTGANGHLGGLAIDYLLEKEPSVDIAGLVRSEEKGAGLRKKGVEVRIGDYADPPSLQKAMAGVDVVLLISSSTMDDRPGQHKNVIDAARQAGVEQLFYTSMVQAEKGLSPIAPDHVQTEKTLKDSGLAYTIYRNTFYMEFLPLFLGNALETGEWQFPSDGEKINLALRTEMAEALANGLLEASNHRDKIYEITSTSAYSLGRISQFLSAATGREITYTDIPVDEFRQNLEDIGLPEDQLAISVMTAQTFVNGALNHTYDHLEKLLGRKPTDMNTFIEEFASQ